MQSSKNGLIRFDALLIKFRKLYQVELLYWFVFFRLEIEVQRTNQHSLEIHSLQRQLAQKELMVEEGRIALQTPTRDLEKLTHEHQRLTTDFQALSQK